ncbi:flavin reductase family protein [Comamonas sp.]|uniref:flavin reductase family protein n=1 Tax=Comamonas sp. TaxID=34028 RepID=UPI002FCCB15F
MNTAHLLNTASAVHPVEEGKPQDDARAFRRCLGQFATGIAIITTEFEGQPVGMAVNSFAAVSLDPALVLWSIRKESCSAQAFLSAQKYAVNILEESQTEVSRIFGAGRADKFEQVNWVSGLHGCPLIAPAIGHFECALEHVADGGDHHILIGRVLRFARFDGHPLLFTQGQYAVAQSHPSLLTPVAEQTLAPVQESSEMPLLSLLKATAQKLSGQFEEHREALGMTLATSRMFNALGDGVCTLDGLERTTYLGQSSTEDALNEMLANGYVTHADASGEYTLTASGQSKVEALRQRAMDFTSQKLKGLTAQEIATAKKVMDSLQTH